MLRHNNFKKMETFITMKKDELSYFNLLPHHSSVFGKTLRMPEPSCSIRYQEISKPVHYAKPVPIIAGAFKPMSFEEENKQVGCTRVKLQPQKILQLKTYFVVK